jgi:maltose alpha-D-glucosyltransferase/alpha-amylase
MIDDLWYKNGAFYWLSVGTYMDANGDGIGDSKGLLRRLDYLRGLGITTIWLMPFQPSPGKDDGYDISDYYGVDPRYGTLGDFVEFTHGCRQRGIRVIIDLVVNHSSDAHPWFREARSSKDLPYRDWYVWADKKSANANRAWFFPVYKNPRGPVTRKPRLGTFIASTTSSQTSTPPIRAFRSRSSKSWISGSSLACPVFAWMPSHP